MMTENPKHWLVLCPLKIELRALSDQWKSQGLNIRKHQVGRCDLLSIDELGIFLGLSGHGKAQTAIQTQYLISRLAEMKVAKLKGALLAGSAGALQDEVKCNDVVVAETSIEHDFRSQFIKKGLPRFNADSDLLNRAALLASRQTNVKLGAVASGDEDIVSEDRRRNLQQNTGALAVGWEGAGFARACLWNQVSHLEIRGITDSANSSTLIDFETTLNEALANVGRFIIDLIKT